MLSKNKKKTTSTEAFLSSCFVLILSKKTVKHIVEVVIAFFEDHWFVWLKKMGISPEKIVLFRNLAAFWIFGLCNNYAYVIMLSAAEDIMDQQQHKNSTVETECLVRRLFF